MSLLEVGKACYQCSTIDFLPFTCPQCSHSFCRDHVHSHGCTLPTTESNAQAGPSSFARKITCDVQGCGRARIEAIAGVTEVGGVGKQVRCSGCQGAFCTMHRSQESHSCSAPLQTNARQDAFLERRAKAKELIAQKFPDTKSRAIPKLPPQRDVNKERPKSPDRLPPSLQPTSVPPQGEPATTIAKTITKSKAEKMSEIGLRKLRSLARPLDPKLQALGERRFFQWAVGGSADVEKWKGGVKVDKKWGKVWVPATTPIGKVLDLLLALSKSPRPKDSNPANAYSIVCLVDILDQSREATKMNNDVPASELIEGSSVLLVKGWMEV